MYLLIGKLWLISKYIYVYSEINNDILMYKKVVVNKIFINNFCCC